MLTFLGVDIDLHSGVTTRVENLRNRTIKMQNKTRWEGCGHLASDDFSDRHDEEGEMKRGRVIATQS